MKKSKTVTVPDKYKLEWDNSNDRYMGESIEEGALGFIIILGLFLIFGILINVFL